MPLFILSTLRFNLPWEPPAFAITISIFNVVYHPGLFAYWFLVNGYDSNWNTLTFYYKLRLIKLFHSVFIGEAPAALSYLTNKPRTAYNLRRCNNVIVPRFNSKFLRNSISYRAQSFGTLSRVITRASLLIFIVKWRRTFISRNLILARTVGPVAAEALPRLQMLLNILHFVP